MAFFLLIWGFFGLFFFCVCECAPTNSLSLLHVDYLPLKGKLTVPWKLEINVIVFSNHLRDVGTVGMFSQAVTVGQGKTPKMPLA